MPEEFSGFQCRRLNRQQRVLDTLATGHYDHCHHLTMRLDQTASKRRFTFQLENLQLFNGQRWPPLKGSRKQRCKQYSIVTAWERKKNGITAAGWTLPLQEENPRMQKRWLKIFSSSETKHSLVGFHFDACQLFDNYYRAPRVCHTCTWVNKTDFCLNEVCTSPTSVFFYNPWDPRGRVGIEKTTLELHLSTCLQMSFRIACGLFFSRIIEHFFFKLGFTSRTDFRNSIGAMELYSGQCWFEWQMICIIFRGFSIKFWKSVACDFND